MGDVFSWLLDAAMDFFIFASVAILLGFIVSLSVWVRNASRWDERAAVSIIWVILNVSAFGGFLAVGAGFWASAGLVVGASLWGFFSKTFWLFFFPNEPS